MESSKSNWTLAAAWIAFLGCSAVLVFLVPSGPTKAVLGNVLLCLVPLYANACLLSNAATPYRRTNAFWRLLALGCFIWLAAQLVWTYYEMALHRPLGSPSGVYLIFFLHTIPLIAALFLQPHARKMGEMMRYGFVDLSLLAWLWLYAYVFLVVPWNTVWPNTYLYRVRDFQTYMGENLVFLVGLGYLCLRARGSWRRVYAHLFGAALTYASALLLATWESWQGHIETAGIHDLLFVTSFVWFGTAGSVAHRIAPSPDPEESAPQRDFQWPAKIAMVGIFVAPLLAAWSIFVSAAPAPVQSFRLLVTLVALLVGTGLVFIRQQLVDEDRVRLVHQLQDTVDNLRRLQSQLVHSERLASLGQLAAGAAHEINNPLTAILGYSDLLVENGIGGDKSRNLGEKIREQARRTKDLVNNLLSFARQAPAEKQLLDLNTVLSGAIQLRTLDLRDKNIRIELKNPTVLPGVRGDPNQLLEVCYHIISNAVDALESVGGGLLTVHAIREKAGVVIEFTDNGPGIREPEKVFDPFYTTKPVGKGTGLGLSICYGIIQEHGGQISCFNRPEGGCTFRIELPAVLALFPKSQTQPGVPVSAR